MGFTLVNIYSGCAADFLFYAPANFSDSFGFVVILNICSALLRPSLLCCRRHGKLYLNKRMESKKKFVIVACTFDEPKRKERAIEYFPLFVMFGFSHLWLFTLCSVNESQKVCLSHRKLLTMCSFFAFCSCCLKKKFLRSHKCATQLSGPTLTMMALLNEKVWQEMCSSYAQLDRHSLCQHGNFWWNRRGTTCGVLLNCHCLKSFTLIHFTGHFWSLTILLFADNIHFEIRNYSHILRVDSTKSYIVFNRFARIAWFLFKNSNYFNCGMFWISTLIR